MTATDELRRLLDERGVKYRIECKQTRATFEPFNRFIVLNERGGLRGTIDVYLDGACNCTWQFDGLTPEQVITATLGSGTCEPDEAGYCPYCGEDLVRCDVGIGEGGGAVELDPPIYYNYCPNCGARVERREQYTIIGIEHGQDMLDLQSHIYERDKQIAELQAECDQLLRDLIAEHALCLQFEEDNERLKKANHIQAESFRKLEVELAKMKGKANADDDE